MFRINRLLSYAFLATTLLFAAANSSCSGRVRVYDEYHSDWHHWDHNEDVVYRSYWTERHEPYREYSKLSPGEQKDYWNWRHSH